MAPLKLIFLALTASVATAFAPTSFTKVPASTTQLQESFGLGLGEDTYENQPDLLKGEQEYKQYVNRISEENMLNRKVCVRALVSWLVWRCRNAIITTQRQTVPIMLIPSLFSIIFSFTNMAVQCYSPGA
jgi:uncharacterized protein (UPF0548 family)